jgi:hypothetical protein
MDAEIQADFFSKWGPEPRPVKAARRKMSTTKLETIHESRDTK